MHDHSLFFVFDVESIGLYGEGFAVGYVVVDRHGNERDSGLFIAPSDESPGTKADREWVAANVLPALEQNVPRRWSLEGSIQKVRTAFWEAWVRWSAQGAWMTADVPWPVESRFLGECIADDGRRASAGPYPLIDVSSVRLAAGLDPLETCSRLAGETPAHNPLADARQSARLLIEALNHAK